LFWFLFLRRFYCIIFSGGRRSMHVFILEWNVLEKMPRKMEMEPFFRWPRNVTETQFAELSLICSY